MLEEKDYLRVNQLLSSTPLTSPECFFPIKVVDLQFVEQRLEHLKQTYMRYSHQHAYWEAHIPLKGTQVYNFDSKTVTVSSGEAIIIAPNTLHSIGDTSVNLCKFTFCFDIPIEECSDDFVWLRNSLFRMPYFKLSDDKSFAESLNIIFDEVRNKQSGWKTMIMGIVSQIVIYFARSIATAQSGEESDSCKSTRTKQMESIMRYVLKNISAPITKQTVGDYMGLSIRQLDRIVVGEKHMTLKSYIDTVKISEAKRLLRDTNMEIKDISEALGFSEASSFSRYFTKFENISPGLFRKNIRQE